MGRPRLSRALLLLLIAWSVSASGARADADSGTLIESGRVWTDIAYFQGSGTLDGYVADGTIFVPRFGATLRPHRDWDLEAAFGFSHAVMGGVNTPLGKFDMGDSTRVANPYLGLRHTLRRYPLRLRTGVGVALPMASDDDGERKANFFGTLGTQAMWDFFLWPESVVSVVLPLTVEADLSESWMVSLDGAAVLMMRTGDGKAGELGPMTQWAAGVFATPWSFVRLGTRATIVWLIGQQGDNAQAALEPSLRLGEGPIHVTTYATVNLDTPLGFALSRNRLWALHLGASAEL